MHSIILTREPLNGAVFTEQGEEQKFVMWWVELNALCDFNFNQSYFQAQIDSEFHNFLLLPFHSWILMG